MKTASNTWKAELVQKLDTAVLAIGDAQRCQQVKDVLVESLAEGKFQLDPALLEPVEGGYGRRLLHLDPAGAYSIVLMIWGSGQSTPLHDHSGMWCVESVCTGTITVKSFDRLPNFCSDSDLYDFECKDTIHAGVGEAGCLIPPFEYHTIQNDGTEASATIHVYGGEIKQCNVFVPQESGYKLEVRQLGYND